MNWSGCVATSSRWKTKAAPSSGARRVGAWAVASHGVLLKKSIAEPLSANPERSDGNVAIDTSGNANSSLG